IIRSQPFCAMIMHRSDKIEKSFLILGMICPNETLNKTRHNLEEWQMKIVIFTLGSRGDVQPYVALAKAAILKGHRAVICTGKSFQALIEENGVEFEQA